MRKYTQRSILTAYKSILDISRNVMPLKLVTSNKVWQAYRQYIQEKGIQSHLTFNECLLFLIYKSVKISNYYLHMNDVSIPENNQLNFCHTENRQRNVIMCGETRSGIVYTCFYFYACTCLLLGIVFFQCIFSFPQGWRQRCF